MDIERTTSRAIVAGLMLGLFADIGRAQADATQDAAIPAIGAVAPDFRILGATRYGVLQDPVRLADFRGQTVVLAFFFQARTRG